MAGTINPIYNPNYAPLIKDSSPYEAQLIILSIYDKPKSMKDIQEYTLDRLHAVTSFLKWYRLNSGLSQQELSEYSGIHRNTITRYESSIPKNLTLLTIFEIADALDLSLNEVFKEI